jgi:tetratricopeptide (TPR) repeat protein
MRGVAIAMLAAAAIAAPAAQQTSSRNRPRIPVEAERALQEAMAAYAAGDDTAAQRWTATAATPATLAYLEFTSAQDRGPWSRSKPAFLLEVAAAVRVSHRYRVPNLLKAGMSLMVSRPSAPGVDAVEDRFEVIWHQAALGLAQGIEQYWLQQDLLDIIRLRFEATGHAHLLDGTRVPLAKAVAAAGLCCWTQTPDEPIQSVPPQARRPVRADDAIALFEKATEAAELRAEALIRGAVLLRKLGRDAEALAWFDRVPAEVDRDLAYVHHLTRARLLDGANRTADAAAAYQQALDADPTSQVAAIGLAAALLRSGQSAEAVSAAARARAIPGEASQPDQTFRRGDLRFVPGWLAELRSLRRK